MAEKRKNRILVCVDFQDQSLVALHQCYDIARFINAEVVLLYVIESNDFFSGLFAPSIESVKSEVEIRLQNLVEKLKSESKIEFSYAIEIGKAYEQIVIKAQEINARFIIMGKNGSNQGLRKILGSNTTHVISESKCPVISIKGKSSIGYKKIVLPLDLTKKTREQVASAISFSRFFGSHLHVVSVLTGGIFIKRSRIYKKMKKVQHELEQNGVTCTLKLYKKSEMLDFEQVISYCNEIHADLIMVMTHQEGRISDYYIGSFAHHIINLSEIPVLSIIPSLYAENDASIIETIVDPFNLI